MISRDPEKTRVMELRDIRFETHTGVILLARMNGVFPIRRNPLRETRFAEIRVKVRVKLRV